MAESSDLQTSNAQLLQELESLSKSLSSTPNPSDRSSPARPNARSRSRRFSLSPWRSLPNLDGDPHKAPGRKLDSLTPSTSSEKKGIWNWKPVRVLTHIGMQRLSCLFSVEVVAIQGLPASMNGLRLFVCVRKKETKDGAVCTMPARVMQCAADFEETLFLRCHVYCAASKQQQLKFEPRPFLIHVGAVDAQELSFGQSLVDLSLLVQESIEKNFEGRRVRQWDMIFDLSGKAKGGELVLKLGFQIMEDKGAGIFSPGDTSNSIIGRASLASSSFARKQSKSSFSISSPRISSRFDVSLAAKAVAAAASELEGIAEFNLNKPESTLVASSSPSVQKYELEAKTEDLDVREFEVVDKGIEIQHGGRGGEAESEDSADERSVSSEVVKEAVQSPLHLTRLTELDSIAKQIKALESMIGNGYVKTEQETEFEVLDMEEETVTREFLHMLERRMGRELKHGVAHVPPLKLDGEEAEEAEFKVFLPDLGKGLGPVIQTRDGGYLASTNPFDIEEEVSRKEKPKLAMQISKLLILPLQSSASGFELFQKMAAIGVEELAPKVLSVAGMDELMGKTAEQIAFEGIAAAIIQGRNKEGATSSASRSITAVKTMVMAMSTGRKERISTGVWNLKDEPLTVEEILAVSLQKIEAMALEGLKIQAEMAEEEAHFDVSPITVDGNYIDNLLASTVSVDQWVKNGGPAAKQEAETPSSASRTITLLVVVQLRDPFRSYEAVGAPTMALIQAMRVDAANGEDDHRFKLASLHVGGWKVRAGGKSHGWDAENQRLTARQWLVAYGLGKAAKKGKNAQLKGQDSLWSISARVTADMWLKPMRNPDVKFSKQI